MKSFKFFALLAIGVMCSALTQRRTQFELENNGYSGLLIAINDEILPSQDFLDGIERTWIDFSEALFNSTGRRAYFNQVVVSLPSTWDHFNFSNISSTSEFSSASSKQGIDWANVIVSERNPSFADAPYTKQTGECGEPGEYIHLTEKFVTDERYTKQAFGNVGKLLVREWGHLRWGLFDESGSSDQSPTKLFYHGMDGSLHPTRCSAQIRGKPQDAVTGGKCEIGLETDLPSDTCMFMPDRDQPEGVTGSVMFMHSLPQITEFCDDEPDTPAGRRHNSEAPNKHNAMCNGRSAWSVMRDHPDFKDGNNAAVPADVIKDVKPKFKYVVQRPKEIVFVIDVSTRENVDKTNEIRQAVGNYIMNQVPLGSKVGLVAFASEATQLSAMTSLRNESDRARLLTHLYNDTLLTEKYTTEERGKTSIGSGLSSAIAMISGGQGGGFSSGDASDSSDPRLTDICLSYLREQTFDASLLSQLPEDISAKDLLTICQSPFYKDQLISSSGGKFDPSDINGDGALISVACEYYSQNGKLSNDHLIKYLELYPKKSYSDLEDTCKAQLISGSGGDGISGNSGIEAIVRAACEHYLVNSDFTTEQILQLKKLFPERTAYKQLTELCEDPDLISGGAGGNGGGAGSSGSRDAMVKEACDYYRANEDFTAEQLFALKSAFPNRSLKEITELCADGELISGSDGEGGVNPSREAIVKEACDYYSLNSDFTTKQYESLKQLYPERTTFKQLTELCDNELISGLDGEGGSDPSGEATVKLACEYYSVNSDFTTKQMEDLKRLYPDRTSFKQLAELCKNDELISGDSGDSKPSDSEIVKRACEYYAVHKDFTREQATDLMEKFTDLSFNELPSLCSDSDLISGDSGDSNPSESEIVKQACEYYAVHKDFTRDQINDLMDKFTDLSFNELPSLCSDSGGGNGAKITLEASCVEYKEEGKLNLKTIENEFKMNLMQFMSKCDEIYPPSSRKRRQSRAVQSELAEKCAEWKEHLDSTDDETDAVYQIVKQSYERDCIENDRVKRSEKSEKCSELEKQLDDAEDSGNDFLVELLKEKLQTDCVEIERVKRSEKSEKCWGLEKELETAEKNGNDIIVEVLKEKIQADCVEEIERVKREEKNDKCIQMEKELEDAKAIGSAEFVLEMIRDKIQTDCAELHRRIIRAAESAECRELKVRFEDAVKDGDAFLEKTFKENFNSKCKEVKRTERDAKSDECEQLEKELEDAKARNKPEFMLQMIEDKIQTDCVEEYERLKRTAKSEECLALEKELADAEATGKTFLVQILKENIKTTCTEDSSESGGSGAACAKQQEDLDKAMRQGVEDYLLDVLRRALLDCKAHNTEGGGVDGGSAASNECESKELAYQIAMQDSSLSEAQKQLARGAYFQCLEANQGVSEGGDGGQGGEGVDCSAWEVMYDNAMKSGTSELIELSRKSLEECRARATKEGGSGGDGTLSCKDIRQLYTSTSDVNVRNMLMQKNAACLTDLDESEIDGGDSNTGVTTCSHFSTVLASMEADPNSDSAAIKSVKDQYEKCLEQGGIDTNGGSGNALASCDSIMDTIKMMQANGGDSGETELIRKLQAQYSKCVAEGGADISGLNEAGSKDNTCATLSSAIDGLSQTVKTDPSPANQESLRSLTASFRTLGCTGNQNADSDYGNYGAISGKNAHEIVLITSYQDSMDVESTITDVDTKGLQEAGVSLTVVHARQFSYIQLMRVINYNNATLFDLSLEKGSNLKGTPGSLFTLQSQDLDAKSAMILQKQVTLNKPFKNLDAETNKTMPIAKFESFNNITTVTVDGGKFLRVIFALDISRLTAKDRVQYPAITVKAPFAPVKGRKSGSQSSFSFSPDSYKDGESDVVKKFNETNTVRFMIPLEGRKAIGNWTITVFEDLSKPEISGQLLVDIPASNPLVIDPPKENKKSTASEPTNENTENEAETEAEKAKRSSELFMEDDIIPESKSEDVGAELQSPVELMDDDEATSEDAEMDPKAARAKLIQKHLDEKNGPIVRLSGKIVEEKRSKMKKVVAELTWGDYHAILDAEVKVMFECGTAGDKTNTRNKDETSRTITLLDNGANGDVTAGDGVYSGFFVYTSKMRCSGRLVATGVQGGPQHLRDLGRVSTVDMAPGVIFTREAEQTVPAFRRELVLESFDNSAGQTTSEVDKIAPARVIDLALVDSSLSKRTVQMKFTRSGDDLDKVTIGKMVQYDIRISANLTEMYLNFDSCFQLKPEHLVDTRIMPDFTTPYTLPMFTFTVPEDVWLQSTSKVFAVGLRANDTLNSSPVSNVVIVALKDPPTTFVPVFIAALLLIAFILLSTLFYVVRRAARKSANSQGKIYIHVPNLNKKRGMGGKMGGHGRKGGSQEVDIESMPKLNTTSQVCVDSY
ncbi:uncharacterized protein LOC134854903 isoform X12 [Symsagittifera roscoffensis]|uniref:uncharacterized protein LOC134854903 isoform X12 n=1 Tax=Symsagittifera roscoffensis TaxID=84072 RepID=UPI00307B2827